MTERKQVLKIFLNASGTYHFICKKKKKKNLYKEFGIFHYMFT